jgi:hypothetical protein
MAKLKRKITFSAWADASKRRPFDRVSAADTVENLDASDSVATWDDRLTAVIVDQVGDDGTPTHLRLYALHDEANRPLDFAPGEEPTALALGDDRYTAFLVHVVIWEDKIVGFDRHTNAPGLGRLAHYFREKAEEKVIFRSLFDPSLSERLKELDGVRAVEYAIHDPHKAAQLRAQHPGMVKDLVPRRFGQKAPSFSVKLGMGRKGSRDAYLSDELTNDLLELADAADVFFDALNVTGKSKNERTAAGNPKTIKLNLLSSRLHRERELPRDPGNPSVPRHKRAYKEIEKVRASFEEGDVLERAVEARLYVDAQE